MSIQNLEGNSVAVIGMACRFPGAADYHEYWNNLLHGKNFAEKISRERWNGDEWGNFIADVDAFDAEFFGIADKEAITMSPQQRIILELSWNCLEDACLCPSDLSGEKVGVFVSEFGNDYKELVSHDPEGIQAHHLAGMSQCATANRISFYYNFNGPSMTIDTSCSGSLTALHLACHSVIRGESIVAVVAGASMLLSPVTYEAMSQMRMLSPTGSCKAFDGRADGYARGEGAAVILLKRLEDALRDGDIVRGIIRGSAINHGGRVRSFTRPNDKAQAELIMQAVKNANVPSGSIAYVETHGTGTPKGDPIEIEGLKKAFANLALEEQAQGLKYCKPSVGLGTAKSSIGHLEAAAGLAGVIKVLLSMEYKTMPQLALYQQLNHRISLDNSPFYIVDSNRVWEQLKIDNAVVPRRAGVSSFGFGGSNGHAVIEEAPERDKKVPEPDHLRGFYLMILSAGSESALVRNKLLLQAYLLQTHIGDGQLADIEQTLWRGRQMLDERVCIICDSVAGLISALGVESGKEQIIISIGGAVSCENGSQIKSLSWHELTWQLVRSENKQSDQYLELLKALGSGFLRKVKECGSTDIFPISGEKIILPGYSFEKNIFAIPYLKSEIKSEIKNTTFHLNSEKINNEAKTYKFIWKPEHHVSETAPALSDIILISASEEMEAQAAKLYSTVTVIRPQDIYADMDKSIEVLTGREIKHVLWDFEVKHDAVNEQMVETQERNLYLLYQFIRRLLAWGYGKKELRLTAITYQTQYIRITDQVNAADSGIWGLLGVVAKEYRKWRVDLLDGEEGQAIPLELLVKSKFQSGKGYGYRNDTLYCRVLAETPKPEVNKSIYRHHGVYVIVGGAGGIGQILTRYLIARYKAVIIWLGRHENNEKIAESLAACEIDGIKPDYISADVTVGDSLKSAYEKIIKDHGKIHGVIHSAIGALDRSIDDMEKDEFKQIAAVKIEGSIRLAEIFGQAPLDFLVFFSSVASIQKLAGQSGYSTGSNFIDMLAYQLTTSAGINTKSINWGYWGSTGIGRSMPVSSVRKIEIAGLRVIEPDKAMEAMEAIMVGPETEYVYTPVDESIFGETFEVADDFNVEYGGCSSGTEAITSYLRKIIAEEMGIAPKRIKNDVQLEQYGLDSIMVMHLVDVLKEHFSNFAATTFYEYITIQEIAAYMSQHYHLEIKKMFSVEEPVKQRSLLEKSSATDQSDLINHQKAPETDKAITGQAVEPLAIIGMSGRFPLADNLNEFWQNIKNGRDCIRVIPEERWDLDGFYTPDVNKALEENISYCKWGGLIDDFYAFDPGFFGITPKEAMSMDPQERLFMEECYRTCEDAGYTRQQLRDRYKGKVGVFVGVTRTGYEWYGPELRQLKLKIRPNTSLSSMANRVSYFFDFNGPSMPVDTMCSSSLSALHMACESIRHGECRTALVGGVNIYTHPSTYEYLCQMHMLSKTGKCHTFGAGADGFVPGEGACAIMIKPLSEAVKDRDNIYAVIRGSSINHDGRTNGFTVPSVGAQKQLVAGTLKKAGITADMISYFEAHGTGTIIGDPIEVHALTQAFGETTQRKQFCAIGSVKANIGHLEGAAGMSGVIKTVLQIKHKILVPHINAEVLNPQINFNASPFYIVNEAREWKRPLVTQNGVQSVCPRIAGISSFGAGGANANVIIEEFGED